MALYENGILISGANTLPQMTLAEYQALPVSERPTYWERTDLNYGNIPASDVTYGSGSVEDALDDLTGYGTNTNGTYYKFIDGTLICTKAFETNISISTTWGALYETSAPISFGDWAHSFISAPIASLTVAGEGLACVPERLSGVTASSAGNSFFFRPTSGTGVLTANLIAIGRWK